MHERCPRSWLFVPGDRRDRTTKALASAAEAVIVDLEDAVAVDRKAEARLNVAQVASDARRCYVRIGDEADWDVVNDADIAGVVLPKVSSGDDVCKAAARFARGSIIAMVESPAALMQLPQIASPSDRLIGLMFGAEDFALCLGPFATSDLTFARSAIAIAAAAHGLQAIDRVTMSLDDADALNADCQSAAVLGFTGKALIHPRQIEPLHRAMSPDERAIAWARRVVETVDDGVTAIDGRLVDEPIVRRARQLLALEARRETP